MLQPTVLPSSILYSNTAKMTLDSLEPSLRENIKREALEMLWRHAFAPNSVGIQSGEGQALTFSCADNRILYRLDLNTMPPKIILTDILTPEQRDFLRKSATR